MKALKCFAVVASIAAAFAAVGCTDATDETVRRETAQLVVQPTCITEGYTEHEYSDGYVCRDTFVPKTDHEYVEFAYGAEKSLKRRICKHCGREKVEYEYAEVDTEVTIDRDRPRPSFADLDVMACAMIIEPTVEDAIRAIRLAEAHGAFGFMVYVSCLKSDARTLENLERIMYCTEKPVLAIAYNNSTFYPQNLETDEMANLLRLSVRAGAAAVDMQGWLFGDYENLSTELKGYREYWETEGYDMSFVSASPKEVCGNPDVRRKQCKFIDEIHEMGGEVLISVHAATQMTSSQIVALNEFMEDMNPDIIKLVLNGSSKETVIEHLKACMELEKRRNAGLFGCKFSVHGQSSLSRLMCPMFGSYIAFCVDRYTEVQNGLQIELDTMTAILNSPELKGKR